MTATVPRSAVPPLPVGFQVELDTGTSEAGGGVWFGSRTGRALRLSERAGTVWDSLRENAQIATDIQGVVARRFVAAGLAHPVPPAATTTLTVVIPVRDRVRELDRCLAALGTRCPVVVVDDASRDAAGVQRVVDRHGARLLRLAVNGGPGAARNAGLAVVETDLVAFVDSDTECSAHALAVVADHLADPAVGAAAPRIVSAHASGRGLLARYASARSSLDMGATPGRVLPYAPISYVPTAALVARVAALRDIVRAAGEVFDPALRYGEDVDLVWRLHDAGHAVRYEPRGVVRHHDPATWLQLLSRRYRHGTSAAPLASRHPVNLAPFVVQPWYIATVAALVVRRPAVATAATLGAVATSRRALRRSGLPAGTVPIPHIVGGLVRTATGLARYGVQFASPALFAGLALRRTRTAAAAALLAPALHDYCTRRPTVNPFGYAVASTADDIAYGTGVLAGCLRQRTSTPLRPVRSRSLHR